MTFNVSGNMPAALIHGEILTLAPLPRGDSRHGKPRARDQMYLAVGGPASPRGP